MLSATDLTRHVGCAHATTLEHRALQGQVEAPSDQDLGLELVAGLGMTHELAYLERLRSEGRRVVVISPRGSLEERENATLAMMREGAQVIYQATFFDGQWLGHADFLIRAERPSALGVWSYDIADTKLARHLSATALLQMAGYAERLAELQGAPVERLTVVAGDGSEHHWRPVDVAAYARRLRAELTDFLERAPQTEPVPTTACGQCRWIEHCQAQWERQDDLSRVAGMRADHRQTLIDAGITTLAQLAAAAPQDLGMLSTRVRDRLHRQAQLQVAERRDGVPTFELLSPQPGRGLQRLPEPDAGDVYLDFEGDPFAEGGRGREYLAGIWTREGEFLHWWAHDAAQESRLTGDLLTWLLERWAEHPGMHVYHYAAYEVSALKRMTAQHAVGESQLDQLLRGERFVDLYQVVRQGMVLSKPSYSIKKVEDFYWQQTRTAAEGEVADGMASVIEYERWLADGGVNEEVLERIWRYNREDVRSTHDLHEWLEERRAELALRHDLQRPTPKPAQEVKDPERQVEEEQLAQRLLAAGQPLLAGLVGWHRREDRHAYWDFFRTDAMTTEELLEDTSTIGDPGAPVAVGQQKRSTIWQYSFPPQDVIGWRPGAVVKDTLTHDRVGTLVEVNADQGWLTVSLGNASRPVPATGLALDTLITGQAMRDALMRLGEQVLAGREPLGLRLLEGRTPPIPLETGRAAGELMRQVGGTLDGHILAVQGPPGAGKSYNGALLIADLLDAGLRVGVTAQAHRVIADLMAKVDRPGVRKGGSHETPGEQGQIRVVGSNAGLDSAIAGGARFIGGTSWLWAREGMAGAVDVLVVDEAGQFSLANAAAVAQGATSLVLLGDPQQLRSPTNAHHPFGAGVSALEHLVGDHHTIPADRGIFLDRTYRMHPAITRFVSELAYEGRLDSMPETARQQIHAPGRLTGSGLRWVPVPHTGNVSSSVEEAQVVATMVEDVLGGKWSDQDGTVTALHPEDILVVAPYNAHVDLLRHHLPAQVPVGTVDKFQGHEGAVVIYAMGSSSAQEAPRGVTFLYDVHRLNVAISRARALAVIVASPALLDAPVTGPEQLRSVNALCLFVEEAQHISPPLTTAQEGGCSLTSAPRTSSAGHGEVGH